MKKKFVFIGAGIIACAVTLSSCVKRSDNVIQSTNKPDETTTETAKEVTKVTVNFNVDGGSAVNSITLEKGKKIIEPITTKDNTLEYTYSFEGWYINSDFSTKFDFNSAINDDITLYAKWNKTINQYTIKWLDDDNTELKTEKINYGETPNFIAPNKNTPEFYYTFVGWDTTPTKVTGDKTYKAVYTSAKNEYTVVWKNDDVELKTEKYKYGETPAYNDEEPTKAADNQYTYTFTGWTPEVNTVTGDVTYTATFDKTVNKYTITFKNGDIVLASPEFEYGKTPVYSGDVPSKASTNTYKYTFDGWNEEIVEVTGAATYTAKFKEEYIDYTVKFVDYDDKQIDSKTYHYGDTIVVPSAPTREATPEFTYTFDGWDKAVSTVTGDVTYKATYKETKNKYTIIWMNGDTKLYDEDIEYGMTPTYHGTTPTKAATAEYTYTFIGWNEEIVAVTGAKTYTAKYSETINKYTITFKNGDIVLASPEFEYGKTPVYSGETPTKASTNTYKYTFDGWNEEIVEVTGAATYTAKFKEEYIDYIVKFVDYNDEEIDTKTYHYGDTIVEPSAPTREATPEFTYTFDGWDKAISTVTGDVTYKATYKETKNKYKVEFDTQGGSLIDEILVEYGSKVTKPANPTLAGMNFDGWYKEASCENPFDFSTEITTAIKLYAKWVEIPVQKYAVTFILNNGEENITVDVKEGNKVDIPASNPTKESSVSKVYTFDTWCSDAELTTPFDFNTLINAETKIYARYKDSVRKYTITFKNGEEVLQSTEVEYDTMPSYTGTTPTKEATAEFTFAFKGWDAEIAKVAGEATYNATYTETLREYTITWKDFDGQTLGTDVLKYGEMPTHSNPTRSNTAKYTYEFKGWSPAVSNVTGAATYTATYTETVREYAITWLNDDGSIISTVSVPYGTLPVYNGETPIKAATKEYTYTFNGWNPTVTTVTAATSYKATFKSTINKYTVTFKNGDTILQETKYNYGQTPTYNGPTPTKESTSEITYTFKGWNKMLSPVEGDIVYEAVFVSNTNSYTITWLNDDNTLIDTTEVDYGEMPTHVNPTKAEDAQYVYTFAGWTPTINSVTGAATYKATYDKTVKEYTITWKDYDGNTLRSDILKYGAEIVEPSTPTRAATAEYTYTFAGWDNIVASTVTGDATYTATYTATKNKYTITWMNGDSKLYDEEVEYGKTPNYTGVTPTKEATAKYSYTFIGWNEEIVEVIGAKTYTAKYSETINKYTITFKNGEEVLQSTEVEYDTMPLYSGTTPTKEATAEYLYTFAGWDAEITKVTGEATYNATYSETLREYTITWLNEDDSVIDTTVVKYGEKPTHANATKESTAEWDYTFVGWIPVVSTVTGDATYKASFTSSRRSYTVTFKNGDVILQQSLVEYGTTPTYIGENPVKESTIEYNYTFSGWNTSVSMVTGDVTYEAIFESSKRQYTYSFLNEDGTSEYKTITADYGTIIEAPNNPTKASDLHKVYTFDGWYTSKTGGTKVTSFGSLESNIAYYARFNEEEKKYTIKWMDGTTELATLNDVSYETEYPNGTPEKSGYTFTGWEEVINSTTITRTATFNENKDEYTITWLNDDGTLLRTDKVLKNDKASYGTKPQKSGYKFLYWAKDGIEFDLNTNITSDLTLKAVYGEVIEVGFGGSYTPWAELVTLADSNATTDSKGRILLNTDVSLNGYTFKNNSKNLVSKDKSQYNTQGADIIVTLPKTGSIKASASWASTSSSGYITIKNSSGTEVYKSSLISGSGTNCNYVVEDLPAGTYTISHEYSVNYNYLCYEVAKEYATVSYVTNITGVTVDATQVVSGMTLESFPSLQRDNYKLIGWYTDPEFNNKFELTTTINQNITLYAKWEELAADEKATVTFASNVSGLTFESITVEKGKTIVLPSKDVAGYRFDNWYTTNTHEAVFNPSTVITKDVTIYANYIKQWTITYKDKDNNIIATSQVDNDTTFGEVATVSAPYVEGYLFEYWTKDGVEFTSTDDILSDITLIAHYKEDDGTSEKITINRTEGLQESAYILFDEYNDATDYVIYDVDSSNNTTRLTNNEYYISNTKEGLRVDLFGLKAGTHKIMIAPEISGSEVISLGSQTTFNVEAYDRSGYAHFNYTEGVGAYNDDGTMKDNAIVLYVTDNNKNTVELSYGGITVKGIGNILNTVGQECNESGHEGQCKMTSDGKVYYGNANTNQGILKILAQDNIPLIIRFVGTVSETGLYKKGTFAASNSGLIDGLTDYDSVNYGGSVGDNGHMARMKSAKNVTIEGVGSDATIDGWGFHFMCESANPTLGKNFEVRNLKFINTPEDAVGMEGVQSGSTITASVERCWIHNNEFYSPNISNPAESDKSEGDGSCDFKRGMYFTCSYNYFEGCHKTNLVGSSDSSLQYNLTYHHNYWYLCKARGPLTRQANVHMYNNIFYGQTDYCMNTRANAYIFSESNLFYACKNPYKVDAGAIKSYNDSISSVADVGKYSAPTVVNDKNDAVSSNCAYNGVSYSSFELNSSLFYKDDYYLQADPTDAKKVIYARCGTAKASLPIIENVSMSDISYVNEAISSAAVNNLTVGNTTTIAKLSKTIYAFKITESATATITYGSDALASTGVLCNEAGVALLTASGTVKLTPGTYFIQPFNAQAGDSKELTQPTFKEISNITIKLEEFDDSEYQNQLIAEFNALVNALPSIEYNDSCYSKINEAYQKYNQLSAASKASVATNYAKLNTANDTYISKGVAYVEGLINQIVTPVTESNANRVYSARSAYNELVTKAPKATVSNYSKLTSAEAQLESIAVNLFLAKVSELPSTITYSSSCLEKIEAAEAAYDALSDDQKKLEEDDANVVAAYQTLKSARSQYNALEADANKVDVTFIVDGITYSTQRITKNTTVALPSNPTKSGYRFDNWYKDQVFSNKFNSSSTITEDTVLYARFVEQITVTFVNMDGTTVLATKSVDKNGAINLGDIPTAKYETGYKFKYWSLSKNGAEFDFGNDFAGNTTLYSVYEESNVSTIAVRTYGGDLESAYVEFDKLENFTDYNAYVKRDGDASFKLLDKQLIRQYSNYYRVDAVGLKAGTYSIKLVPFANSSEVSDAATIISNITVKEHTRTGFAFVNGTSSGAYNDDGTLKSNAQVVYVANSNKDTVTLTTVDKKGNTVTLTGIQNIITNMKSNTKCNPLCIRFIGNITDPSVLTKGDLYIDTASAGLTIEGIGNDTTINGFGIVMKNSSNVEVRNLGFMNCNSEEGDCCGLQQGNDHCWVHNCDFFYGDAGSDADQVKGDGSLDTKTSSYITHSFNHFWDTGKSNLQGMKSEKTTNYITYHHNWYDHSDSRHPRIRTCTVHIYNNYFDGNSKYGVGVTMGASAFVENNYFRSTATMKPMLISMQGSDIKDGKGTFSSENGGIIKAYGNTFDGNASFISHTENATSFDAYVATSRDEKVPDTYKALQGSTTYNNFDTDSSLMYNYNVETPEEAKETVTSYAGRVQGGDLKWTFNNETDDPRHDVDTNLKNALVNYTGTLVNVLGIDSSSQGGETPVVDTSADEVIALIEALPLPANVTLDDTANIYAARSAYQKLSSENQTKVTNYSKLQQCIARLNELGNDDEDNTTGVISFDASKKTYTVTGNVSTTISLSGYKALSDTSADAGVTYNGNTYESAAKFDSKSSIKFTLVGTQTVKVYAVGKKAGTTLYVGDNVLTTTTSLNEYTYTLSAGTYEIKQKSGETYVFLIVIE